MRIKNKIYTIIGFIAIMLSLSISSFVEAAAPTLSLSATTTGDNVQVTVSGDANSTVILYYTKSSSGPQLSSIGTTNSSGYFSQSISTSSYGVSSNSAVHVLVNGQQSNDVAWPTVTTNYLTLNKTGLVLNLSSSSIITASNSALYLLNNSNPSIANISISGSLITVTGNSYGSTVATICPQGSSSNCPSVYIVVSSSSPSLLNVSQSNVTLSSGQSVPITISSGTGIYTILSNTNSGIVQASLSGSVLTLSTSSSSGFSAITVCSSDLSSCAVVNVTISSVSSSAISFSQTSPTISIGQSLTVGLAGGSGTYYVSYNSNNAVVQTVLSGSNLTLTGLTNGTASLTVCSSIGGCNVLYVTVNYLSSGGTLSLSQSNVAILVGQTLTVIVSGGTSPYSLTANSGTVFTSAIAGNTITLYGVRAGNSYVNVCSAEAACIPLNVTVTGSGTASLVANPTSVSLNIGKSTTVYLSGSGGYYLSGNTNQGVSTATISGSYISITGVAVGSNVISACQSGGQCTSISVSVTNTATTSSTSPSSFLVINKNVAIISAGQSSTSTITGGLGSNYSVAYNSSPSTIQTSLSGSSVTFSGIKNGTAIIVICDANSNCGAVFAIIGSFSNSSSTSSSSTTTKISKVLAYGDSGADVMILQKKLTTAGLYSGSLTGDYDAATVIAVRKYQSSKGIKLTGNVGPLTLESLNK